MPLICPVCSTNNGKNQNAEYCVQCGSDLHVHRLLSEVRMEKNGGDGLESDQASPKKSKLRIISQMVPTVLLLIGTVFGVFVGIRFLIFLDRMESQKNSLSKQWFETGFEQLRAMNVIIKQELDLILDQRRENQALQVKLQELTPQIQKNKGEETLVSSPIPWRSIPVQGDGAVTGNRGQP